MVRERMRLNRLLGEATGLRTDLNLATARGLRLRRLIDPYVQHCLRREPLPPVMPAI